MADDPNPVLSGQLTDARAVLRPQISGLDDLKRTTISDALRNKLQETEDARVRRDNLLAGALAARDAYIAALDALEADGYPALPNVSVDDALLAEMTQEKSDLDAALKIFQHGIAATISIDLGEPVEKPSP